MRRPETPATPLCASPVGDSTFTTFGPFNRSNPKARAVSEAWTNLALSSQSGTPRDRVFNCPADLPGSDGNSPPQSDEETEIPDFYRVEGANTIGVPLLPDFELWVSLKGGNGSWQKRKAVSKWRLELAQHQDSEATRIAELKNATRAVKEASEKRRLQQEELQRRVEEDAIERRRRQDAEEIRLYNQREEEDKQRRILAEKREQMHKPRPCKFCSGTGKCVPCNGKGCTLTLFLAPVVSERTTSIHGQLPRGCSSCGGCGDDAYWGDFVCGSGTCQSCSGKGQVPAPVNGWPDCQVPVHDPWASALTHTKDSARKTLLSQE